MSFATGETLTRSVQNHRFRGTVYSACRSKKFG